MWGGKGGGAYGKAVGGVLPRTGQDRDSLGCTEQRTAQKCVGGKNSLFPETETRSSSHTSQGPNKRANDS